MRAPGVEDKIGRPARCWHTTCTGRKHVKVDTFRAADDPLRIPENTLPPFRPRSSRGSRSISTMLEDGHESQDLDLRTAETPGSRSSAARAQVMKAHQVNVPASTVVRHLEEIDNPKET